MNFKALTKFMAVLALCTGVSQAQRGGSAGSALPGPIIYNNGAQSVELNGVQKFQDTFSTGLDTANRWTCTNGGGGVAATNAVGATVLSSGATLNGFSKCTTQKTFVPTEPGFVQLTSRINIETPVLATGYRFWGLGTSSASPTIAAPITQGIGIEIGTDGHFDCVTYATGTRLLIRDLTSAGLAPVNYSMPVGGTASSHSYITRSRGDTATYYIDQVNPVNGAVNAVPVCAWYSGAQGPDVNELPVLIEAISNGSTAVTIQVNAVIVSDTGRSTVNPTQAVMVDHSGSITLGGTSQTLAVANTARSRIVIQNPCTATSQGIAASENLFINFTSAASATAGSSVELLPCGSYDSGNGPVTTELITVIAATTAHKFVCKEQ